MILKTFVHILDVCQKIADQLVQGDKIYAWKMYKMFYFSVSLSIGHRLAHVVFDLGEPM